MKRKQKRKKWVQLNRKGRKHRPTVPRRRKRQRGYPPGS